MGRVGQQHIEDGGAEPWLGGKDFDHPADRIRCRPGIVIEKHHESPHGVLQAQIFGTGAAIFWMTDQVNIWKLRRDGVGRAIGAGVVDDDGFSQQSTAPIDLGQLAKRVQ